MADDNCKLEIFQQTDIGIIKDTIACSQLKIFKITPSLCMANNQ